jgi:hypothetical protein
VQLHVTEMAFLLHHSKFHLLPSFSEPGYRSRYSDCLWAGRPRSRSSSPGRFKNLLHVVQAGSGAHPASYPMGKAVGV